MHTLTIHHLDHMQSIQAIGVMQHYRKYWPVLILMPVSVVEQWQSELLKFLGDFIGSSNDLISVAIY